jgi:predicted aldo/keto reductase-like oxidoreductase
MFIFIYYKKGEKHDMMNDKEKCELLERSLQKLMGDQLDMSRISGMSDRSFEQYERSTKIRFNATIRLLKEELYGIKSDYIRKQDNTATVKE